MDLGSIDIAFDFTSDSPHYWDSFWDNNNGLGAGGSDPDSASKTLQQYHQLLWSKPLPNGEYLDLKMGFGANYLTWRDFRFGSDSIIASFRYERYSGMIEQVKRAVPDYRAFMESFLRRTYTIGGMIIFPKWRGGINQSRGCNPQIKDRWDLTLECIRKYYQGEKVLYMIRLSRINLSLICLSILRDMLTFSICKIAFRSTTVLWSFGLEMVSSHTNHFLKPFPII